MPCGFNAKFRHLLNFNYDFILPQNIRKVHRHNVNGFQMQKPPVGGWLN